MDTLQRGGPPTMLVADRDARRIRAVIGISQIARCIMYGARYVVRRGPFSFAPLRADRVRGQLLALQPHAQPDPRAFHNSIIRRHAESRIFSQTNYLLRMGGLDFRLNLAHSLPHLDPASRALSGSS